MVGHFYHLHKLLGLKSVLLPQVADSYFKTFRVRLCLFVLSYCRSVFNVPFACLSRQVMGNGSSNGFWKVTSSDL